LFDEELALLRCGGSYDPAREERERQVEALEQEKDVLMRRRARVSQAKARFDAKVAKTRERFDCALGLIDHDLEAAEQLLDELVYDKVVADRLALERAENRGRMG
jgi:hypothetical protein